VALSRRSFLKTSCAACAGVAAGGDVDRLAGNEPVDDSVLKGKNLAMAIDLQRCTGCAACVVSCKTENNTQAGVEWSSKKTRTVGKFPNVQYEYIPTLCNHCERAPCASACPTKAMYKSNNGGLTRHSPRKCIGCGTCLATCPYDVISRHKYEEPHQFWRDETAVIANGTATPREVTERSGGKVIPYYNVDKETDDPGEALRYRGIVEKCTFCHHRLVRGELPACVEACPADARIFGDLNDKTSDISRLIKRYRPWRLKEHLGTEPKVFYVRNFNAGHARASKGDI